MKGRRGPERSMKASSLTGVVLLTAAFFIYLYKPWLNKRSFTTREWHPYPREWLLKDGHDHDVNASINYVSYNVLSDINLRKSTSDFPAISPDFRNLATRQERLLVEMRELNPDVACLQEVDQVWLDTFWSPRLSAEGFTGISGLHETHPNKVGQAIFWKQKRFSLVNQDLVWFRNVIKPYIQGTSLEKDQEFAAWVTRRSRLPLVELLDDVTKLKVIVGCTHISNIKDEAPAMQALQVALNIQSMVKFSESIGTKTMILSGDFNSEPDQPVYEFIETGYLTENMKQVLREKTPIEKLKPEMRVFAYEVVNIMPTVFAHNINLKSAYKTVMHREPKTTSFSGNTLDYVWYTPGHLAASRALKEPSNPGEIRKNRPEAYHRFPSDHLPLKTTLLFGSEEAVEKQSQRDVNVQGKTLDSIQKNLAQNIENGIQGKKQLREVDLSQEQSPSFNVQGIVQESKQGNWHDSQQQSVQQPAAQLPGAQQPVVQEQFIQQPAAQQKLLQQTVKEQQYVEQPVAQQPVALQQFAHQPFVQQPIAQQPFVKQPFVDTQQQKNMKQPIVQQYVQQPVAQQPVAHKQFVKQRAAQKVQQLAADTQQFNDQPVVQQQHVEQPVAQPPVAQQPFAQQPVAQLHYAQQHYAQQFVTKQRVAQQPVAPQPVAQQPVAHQNYAQPQITRQQHVLQRYAQQPVEQQQHVEQPVVQQQYVEKLVVQQPVAEQPVVQQPVVKQQFGQQPVA